METDSAPSELQSHLGYWLRAVSNAVSSAFAEKLGRHGISVAEWVVLRLVHGDATMLPASVIAEVAGMTRGAISKIVDKLENRDFLERRTVPQDGRAQILRLTAKGVRLVIVLVALADENDAEFFGVLSKQDRAHLMRICQTIAARKAIKTIPVD